MMTDPTDEQLEAFAKAADEADTIGASGMDMARAGIAAVLELVQRDEIEPLEEALAASERDVATAGRRLHAALHEQKESTE
jgi:hypothetical protein